MRQVWTFSDERLRAWCAYCSSDASETRDHVPPKVFLDAPYPESLPVVGSCRACNEGASLDEEYVACLIEVAVCAGAEVGNQRRPKIARKFKDSPALASRLGGAIRRTAADPLAVDIEQPRVDRVVEKLGRGLWAYETSENTGQLSAAVRYTPVGSLADSEVEQFLALPAVELLPEVGSRLFCKLFTDPDRLAGNRWEVVQPDRFAYAVDPVASRVKLILGGYLAAEVDLLHEADAGGL